MTADQLEKVLEQTHEWARAADQKVSILLAFEGVFLLLLIEKITSAINKAFCDLSVSYTLGYLVVLFFFVFSIIKSAYVILPRLKHDHKKNSPIFFGDIAKISFTSFKENIFALDQEKFKKELVKQIYACSKVAKEKYTAFIDSFSLLFISATLWALIEICQINLIS